MSKPTVHHWIVASTIQVHCNKLKPTLIEENKWARLDNGGNNYKIDCISKERLECIGQLLDVMEVVVEAQQFFNTSESTNDDTEDEGTDQTEIG